MTRDQIIERVKTLMHVGDRSDLSPSDEALIGDIATAIVDMLAGEVEALQAENARLGKIANRLIAIVEGIENLTHGTWRAEKNNLRIKDTDEWVEFYNAFRRRAALTTQEKTMTDLKTEWERRADIAAEERRMKQIAETDALAEIQRLGQEIDQAGNKS